MEIHGEADITAVADIDKAFRALIENGSKHIVIDCTGAEFVDSKVVEALIRGARAAQRSGVAVAAACSEGAVARALEICGVEHAMPLHASRADAVAAL